MLWFTIILQYTNSNFKILQLGLPNATLIKGLSIHYIMSIGLSDYSYKLLSAQYKLIFSKVARGMGDKQMVGSTNVCHNMVLKLFTTHFLS